MVDGWTVCLLPAHNFLSVAGESKSARGHREEFLKFTAKPRKYGGPMVSGIRTFLAKEVMPLAAHTWYWQRAMRWVKEYATFAIKVLEDEVAAGRDISQSADSIQGLLGDGEMVESFIGSLTMQKVGFSVPRSARRFLSAARERLGFSSLIENKVMQDMIRGFERRTPRSPMQSEGLEVGDVERIAEAYGPSRQWWKVQVATMVALGFVGILRMIELVSLKIEGVMVVMKDGREIKASLLSRVPRRSEVEGIFMHIQWRKANQSMSTWIPVSCPTAIGLLLRHLSLLRKVGRTSGYLFPSRTGRGYAPRSKQNHVDTGSARDALRKALKDVCGLQWEHAKLYGGHALRVGGSNHIRRLGVDDEVHRLMGGWASLTSSRGYFALTAKEQFKVTHSFALKKGLAPRVVCLLRSETCGF